MLFYTLTSIQIQQKLSSERYNTINSSLFYGNMTTDK